MTHFNYTLTEFQPGEAERITGVSTTLQRDWRRRKFLAANEGGHARFDLFGVANLLFLRQMSDRGIGPQIAARFADIASAGIATGALLHRDAFEGDKHPLPVYGGDGDLLAPNEDLRGALQIAFSVVRKTTTNRVVKRVMPGRFLIIWADGTEYFATDVETAIERMHIEGKAEACLNGPIIVLDQYLVGAALRKKAGRPLVHVEAVETAIAEDD